jgi:hypothetical protein
VNGFTFWELDADQPSGPVSGWGEARHLLGNFARNGEVHWNAKWGACINQEHMLGTILVMSVHVVDCLQKQWVKLSPEDQWAYVYTWLHVGRIMGVKEDLIPRDLQQAKDLWGLIRRRQYDYSEANVDLQQALVKAVAPLFPRYFGRSGPQGYVCKLNGPEVARNVGIRRTWRDRFSFAWWFGVQRVLTWLEVRSTFLRRHLASAATTLIRNLRHRHLAGGARFDVPTTLSGRWALEGQGFTPWARQIPAICGHLPATCRAPGHAGTIGTLMEAGRVARQQTGSLRGRSHGRRRLAVRARTEAALGWIREPDAETYLKAAGGANTAAPSAERRHMAVMFCDLRHSTEISAGADPEDLRRSSSLTTGPSRRWSMPSMATSRTTWRWNPRVFRYPTAHEDDADRAIRAALIIAQSRIFRGAWRCAPEVRVGVHFGRPRGRDGQRGPGRAPRCDWRDGEHCRARAGACTTVDSGGDRRSRRPDPPRVRPHAHRPASAQGAGRSFELFEVTGEDAPVEAERDRVSAFVGREPERALLDQAWSEVLAGHGRAFLIVGEAGIGKSRLCAEFLQGLRGSDHVVIQLRGSAFHQDSAFRPIIQHISRTVLGLEDETPAEEARARLNVSLAELEPRLVEHEPQIAALLGIRAPADSAGLSKEETIQSLAAWVAALARARPVVLLVEDSHWLDPSTVESLQNLVPMAGDHRLLVLLTARPSLTLYSSFGDVERITLERLEPDEALALARSLAADFGSDRARSWLWWPAVTVFPLHRGAYEAGCGGRQRADRHRAQHSTKEQRTARVVRRLDGAPGRAWLAAYACPCRLSAWSRDIPCAPGGGDRPAAQVCDAGLRPPVRSPDPPLGGADAGIRIHPRLDSGCGL